MKAKGRMNFEFSRSSGSKRYAMLLMTVCAVAALLTGCSTKNTAKTQQAVPVKVMQVMQKDTPVSYEFVGELEAKDQVSLQSKVSGNIVAKMITGGAVVSTGQPLFQIDQRQYDIDVLNKKALVAQSEATLIKARRDLERNRVLYSKDAVSQQDLDSAIAEESQDEAQLEANQAQLQQSLLNLSDTLIVSPLDGRIDFSDLSVGAYVVAGQTSLATVSTVDPIKVKFSLSENDYLAVSKQAMRNEYSGKAVVQLLLSDGSMYPLTGEVDQVDRGLSQQTGTLTLKAVFANPDQVLVPGMFARAIVTGKPRQGALLIPQRAVQQVLGKDFVTVVAEGDKAESRPVKLGPKIGNTLVIVEDGLTASDQVVVEGVLKAIPGATLQITMMQPEELQITENK